MTNRMELDLVQDCAVAVFAIDTMHHVIYWNRACENLTGVEAGAVLGTDLHGQVFYHPARPCLSDLVLDGGLDRLSENYEVHGRSVLFREGWHAEGWHSDLGDRRRYVTLDATRLHGPHGDLAGVVETLQDITKVEETEERYRDAEAESHASLDGNRECRRLVPICGSCKRVRDSSGRWKPLETYVEESYGVEFSDGLCIDCAKKQYPECVEYTDAQRQDRPETGDNRGRIVDPLSGMSLQASDIQRSLYEMPDYGEYAVVNDTGTDGPTDDTEEGSVAMEEIEYDMAMA